MKEKELPSLFQSNRDWRQARLREDPTFFDRLASQHTPRYFWIGCADARVPANEICGVSAGEMFVHRNIANVVTHSDFNCQSVLQFAVDVLQVEHVMVVGHYGCSGVRAALSRTRVGLADNWLHHVRDVHEQHARHLDMIEDVDLRHAKLCELNVLEQAVNVCQSNVVQDAWGRGQPLCVHAWIYGVADGLLRDLHLTASSCEELPEAYRRAMEVVLGVHEPAPPRALCR